MQTDTKTEYDAQAETFLAQHGVKLRITLSNTKPANWEPSGNHYRVTLSRISDYTLRNQRGASYRLPSARMTFDFWGSANDAAKGEDPSAYDVLACISGDAYTPETFEDFCDEYGYEADSRKALQTFNRAHRFAQRLRAFFSASELEALQELR